MAFTPRRCSGHKKNKHNNNNNFKPMQNPNNKD